MSYAQGGIELTIKAKSNLRPSSTTPTELLGNYDSKYWVRYVVQHYQELNHNDCLDKSVLWFLLSKKSCWNQRERQLASPGIWNFRESTNQVQEHRMPLQAYIQKILDSHYCLLTTSWIPA